MNNLVEIKYTKSEKYPQIIINGEPISRYMELSDYIYDDMFNWAGRMFESVDDELEESYCLEITGHPFHYEILKSAQSVSRHCAEIRFAELEYSVSPSDKFKYALNLNKQYSAVKPLFADRITFSCDDPEEFAASVSEQALLEGIGGAYYITGGQLPPQNPAKYCVILGENVKFEKKHGVSYLYITNDILPLLIDYFNTYHIYIDFVNSVFAAVGDGTLSLREKLEFEAYNAEEYRVLLNTFPAKMDVGEKFCVEFSYFPECFRDPELRLVSENEDIVSCNGNVLIANNAGTCAVKVIDMFGTEHQSHSITVEKHNYVSNISFVLPATSMNIEETLMFKCIVSPIDAEDVDTLHYSVSDETVAVLSGKNELNALSAGRVRVTVSTARVSKSFYITVYPRAYDVELPTTSLEMPYNSDADISCVVVPANARPMPEAVWTSSNSKVVKILNVSNYGCKVRALSVGTATLYCGLDGTDIKRSIKINVAKPRGCYIATSVYGSYDCPEVWALRRYRDNYLAEHTLGRAFIEVYYALSPTAVRLFGKTKWFNGLWKSILDRKVKRLRNKGYEDTPYEDK